MQLAPAWTLLGLSVLLVAALPVLSAGEPKVKLISGPEHVWDTVLFDFAHYKDLFGKVYSDPLEDAVRMNYFMARAYRVAVSAIKYIYKQTSYHFALNHLSDATPRELERMLNYVKPDKARVVNNLSLVKVEIPAGSDGTSSRYLGRLSGAGRKADWGSGEAQQTEQGTPAKRGSKFRELPVKKLITRAKKVKLGPQVEAKWAAEVKSDTEKRESTESVSRGVANQLGAVDWQQSVPRSKASREMAEAEATSLKGRMIHLMHSLLKKEALSEFDDEYPLPDEVFLDLRTSSKCFSPPRDQKQCSSSYAFAMIASMEWLYCMQTGKLALFSEQYIINCGEQYYESLNGCQRGTFLETIKFVINFGLDLLSDCPYSGVTDTCIFEDADLRKSGFIRPNRQLSPIAWAETKDLAPYLEYGPINVDIKLADGFVEYGGGVHGMGCQDHTAHAAVIIGHGRENGREYWLVRNSMGPEWGEGGYYKLDKQANCIHHDYIYMLSYHTIKSESIKAFADPAPAWAKDLSTLLPEVGQADKLN